MQTHENTTTAFGNALPTLGCRRTNSDNGCPKGFPHEESAFAEDQHRLNQADDNYSQLYFDVSAMIDKQGNSIASGGSGDITNYNKWTTHISGAVFHGTFFNSSIASQSWFYYPKPTLNGIYPYEQGNASNFPLTGTAHMIEQQAISACDANVSPTVCDKSCYTLTLPRIRPNDAHGAVSMISGAWIVNEFKQPTEANWNGQRQLYNQLRSTLADTTTVPDTTGLGLIIGSNLITTWQDNFHYAADMMAVTEIGNWYSSLSSSNIAKFYNVEQLIASGDYTAAQTLNNSITTAILPELNQKQMNDLIISHYLQIH